MFYSPIDLLAEPSVENWMIEIEYSFFFGK